MKNLTVNDISYLPQQHISNNNLNAVVHCPCCPFSNPAARFIAFLEKAKKRVFLEDDFETYLQLLSNQENHTSKTDTIDTKYESEEYPNINDNNNGDDDDDDKPAESMPEWLMQAVDAGQFCITKSNNGSQDSIRLEQITEEREEHELNHHFISQTTVAAAISAQGLQNTSPLTAHRRLQQQKKIKDNHSKNANNYLIQQQHEQQQYSQEAPQLSPKLQIQQKESLPGVHPQNEVPIQMIKTQQKKKPVHFRSQSCPFSTPYFKQSGGYANSPNQREIGSGIRVMTIHEETPYHSCSGNNRNKYRQNCSQVSHNNGSILRAPPAARFLFSNTPFTIDSQDQLIASNYRLNNLPAEENNHYLESSFHSEVYIGGEDYQEKLLPADEENNGELEQSIVEYPYDRQMLVREELPKLQSDHYSFRDLTTGNQFYAEATDLQTYPQTQIEYLDENDNTNHMESGDDNYDRQVNYGIDYDQNQGKIPFQESPVGNSFIQQQEKFLHPQMTGIQQTSNFQQERQIVLDNKQDYTKKSDEQSPESHSKQQIYHLRSKSVHSSKTAKKERSKINNLSSDNYYEIIGLNQHPLQSGFMADGNQQQLNSWPKIVCTSNQNLINNSSNNNNNNTCGQSYPSHNPGASSLQIQVQQNSSSNSCIQNYGRSINHFDTDQGFISFRNENSINTSKQDEGFEENLNSSSFNSFESDFKTKLRESIEVIKLRQNQKRKQRFESMRLQIFKEASKDWSNLLDHTKSTFIFQEITNKGNNSTNKNTNNNNNKNVNNCCKEVVSPMINLIKLSQGSPNDIKDQELIEKSPSSSQRKNTQNKEGISGIGQVGLGVGAMWNVTNNNISELSFGKGQDVTNKISGTDNNNNIKALIASHPYLTLNQKNTNKIIPCANSRSSLNIGVLNRISEECESPASTAYKQRQESLNIESERYLTGCKSQYQKEQAIITADIENVEGIIGQNGQENEAIQRDDNQFQYFQPQESFEKSDSLRRINYCEEKDKKQSEYFQPQQQLRMQQKDKEQQQSGHSSNKAVFNLLNHTIGKKHPQNEQPNQGNASWFETSRSYDIFMLDEKENGMINISSSPPIHPPPIFNQLHNQLDSSNIIANSKISPPIHSNNNNKYKNSIPSNNIDTLIPQEEVSLFGSHSKFSTFHDSAVKDVDYFQKTPIDEIIYNITQNLSHNSIVEDLSKATGSASSHSNQGTFLQGSQYGLENQENIKKTSNSSLISSQITSKESQKKIKTPTEGQSTSGLQISNSNKPIEILIAGRKIGSNQKLLIEALRRQLGQKQLNRVLDAIQNQFSVFPKDHFILALQENELEQTVLKGLYRVIGDLEAVKSYEFEECPERLSLDQVSEFLKIDVHEYSFHSFNPDPPVTSLQRIDAIIIELI